MSPRFICPHCHSPVDALVVRKSPMAFARRLEFYADPANVGVFAQP